MAHHDYKTRLRKGSQMLNASYQVDYASWDSLKESVQEAFGVELVTPDDQFSLTELFSILEEKGLDPCFYERGVLWRVHADRGTNWWSDDADICVAGARAAMSWYLSQLGNDGHPIYGRNRT